MERFPLVRLRPQLVAVLCFCMLTSYACKKQEVLKVDESPRPSPVPSLGPDVAAMEAAIQSEDRENPIVGYWRSALKYMIPTSDFGFLVFSQDGTFISTLCDFAPDEQEELNEKYYDIGVFGEWQLEDERKVQVKLLGKYSAPLDTAFPFREEYSSKGSGWDLRKIFKEHYVTLYEEQEWTEIAVLTGEKESNDFYLVELSEWGKQSPKGKTVFRDVRSEEFIRLWRDGRVGNSPIDFYRINYDLLPGYIDIVRLSKFVPSSFGDDYLAMMNEFIDICGGFPY